MRIVATSDTHFPPNLDCIPHGDVFIHAGDLMQTGYPSDFAQQLEWLSHLPHPVKLYVPGNHDCHLKVYPGPALQDLRAIGVTVLGFPGNDGFQTYKLPNGMIILGDAAVTGLPRWAFNDTEENIWERIKDVPCDILVTHAPPHGLLDDKDHQGIVAYRKYITEFSPKISICGHIHEAYGFVRHGNTDIYNVAMSDRSHCHKNPPLVLDV